MDSWMIGSLLGLLGLITLSYLLYVVFFARGGGNPGGSARGPLYRGFRHREADALDERRQDDQGPPPGLPERRKGPRRIDR
ncbi:MAG: hypothetical protein KGJ55_09965 [Gammaproteobacteria bacterium]|nr:hypothetical protein [Gammaproteobacteria bacterium]